MASQPGEESRFSRIVNGASLWISVLVIFIYAILCIISTALYAFKLTLPTQYHLIDTILWAVANTLGGLLLAMTIYGWAQFFLRRRQGGSSAASKVVSGERALAKKIADSTNHLGSSSTTQQSAQQTAQHSIQQGAETASGGVHHTAISSAQGSAAAQPTTGLQGIARTTVSGSVRTGLASVVSRTVLVVASSALIVTAVAPQHALDLYNQPPPAHSVSIDPILALAQSAPTVTPTPTPNASATILPVMKSDFLSTGRQCGDVATDIFWSLTNTARNEAGKASAVTVNWVAFVGDSHFVATPSSGTLAPNQTATIRVRGPALPAGQGLYLSLYVTDTALDSNDITNPVKCG